MSINSITKTQKKIIIAASLAILVFVIFLFFVYIPGKKEMSQLKSTLQAKQKEIQDIQMMVDQGQPLEESIRMLKERFDFLEGKFPVKEEEPLRMISDLARKAKVNLVSINPGPKKNLVDKNQKNLTVDNKACQRITVAISLDCSYKDLVKYIELLKQELSALVIVDNLEVNKNNSGSNRDLKVRLGISFYLLS
ncbi:MAG: hypothetical protein KKH93_00980 [Candidatus Omnitrophica bacterium]|nr:hypothetical protein [Candidatus Omnitrophota bacterium]MBU2043994.1 hypothetical protein [Candidatus Omnitrophota bacterium]MBU2250984.1 hypothetical protein [Candidatus Omnitrophota bacterium]MBU2265525.1 hypothetical protein [Candidatus Omnitrophota bacterium]MBU2473958.1 hypothetical protein [Candidatus Omnitrophota bacterium]